MSEMVERVAAEIFESQEWEFAPNIPFHEQTDGTKEVFRVAAHAAIEAMREPTEVMLDAALEAADWANELDERKEADVAWHAMIDEALK